MTKAIDATPTLNKNIRRNQKQNDYYEFFEPLIGYSQGKRLSLGKLYGNGFRIEHWLKLCDLIKESDAQLGILFHQLTNRKMAPESGGIIWLLIHTIIPETFTLYLDKQIQAHAKEGMLSIYAIAERLGIGRDSNARIVADSGEFADVSRAIRDALSNYFESDDEQDMFKARSLSHGIYEIKYNNKKVTVGSKNSDKHIFEFSNLKAFITDIVHSKESIKTIQERHRAKGVVFYKVFEVFNPDKVINEFESELEWILTENIPIEIHYDALFSIFGATGYKKYYSFYDFNLPVYEALTIQKIAEQKERVDHSNLAMLKQRKNVFRLVYCQAAAIKFIGFKIAYNHLALYDEWAEWIYSDAATFRQRGQSLSYFFNHIVTMSPRAKDFSVKDIQKNDLISYLDSGISNTAATESVRALRGLITFLQDREELNRESKMGILPKAPQSDPSKGISIKEKDRENHQPIPDEVHETIMLHRDKLETTIKNAYILISETGMRPKELEGVTSESLIEENGKMKLSIWQYKTQRAHARKGKKPIRTVPLSSLAIAAFKEQVRFSQKARKESGLSSIFVRKNPNNITYRIVEAFSIKDAINRLIKKHAICNPITDELWHYSPYQLRVKLVVDMVENGASHEQLKAFLGHIGDSALQRAYAMVEKFKLMEMNTEFFQKEFSITISQNAIDQYTEEELKEIVVMFYVTSRDMMYGKCMRHPSQGICGKLHEAASCAPCDKLHTEASNRKEWEALYTQQCIAVFNLRKWYEERDFQEKQYAKFEFYTVQEGILWSYASVLFKMEHVRRWRVSR